MPPPRKIELITTCRILEFLEQVDVLKVDQEVAESLAALSESVTMQLIDAMEVDTTLSSKYRNSEHQI